MEVQLQSRHSSVHTLTFRKKVEVLLFIVVNCTAKALLENYEKKSTATILHIIEVNCERCSKRFYLAVHAPFYYNALKCRQSGA